MNSPGIEVQPIPMLEGTHSFNSVFLSDVKVPKKNLLGEEGKGWSYAKFLLEHERVENSNIGFSTFAMRRLHRMAGEVRSGGRPLLEDAVFRAKVSAVEAQLKALEITTLRALSAMGIGSSPGAGLASSLKIRGTEIGQRITELLFEAAGPQGRRLDAALLRGDGDDVLMPRDDVRWGTNGIAGHGVKVRVIDLDGREVATGDSGQIILKSLGVFKGYWNRPEATAEVLRDGWVHTGDIGSIDADGYLTFIGRVKEMIKVCGFSVFPEEVEAILILHPEVAQVAVIGVPDADKGKVVKAFVVPKDRQRFDTAELTAWARENMSHYKVPRSVQLMDALPATGTGKVLRRLLRDLPAVEGG